MSGDRSENDPAVTTELAATAAAGPKPAPANSIVSVDLGGWDTISAVKTETLNKMIQGQNNALTHFDQDDGKFSAKIKGTWKSWEIVPDPRSNGGVVVMKWTVLKGTGTTKLGATSPLDGAEVIITVHLARQDTPNLKIADKTAKPGTGTVTSLMVQKKSTPNRATAVVNSVQPHSLSGDFKIIFDKWFGAKMKDFDALFHSCVLNAQVDTTKSGNFQWVKPQELSYASVTDSASNGMFGALCKTEKTSIGSLTQQIPPGVLTNMPKNVNSVFAISAERFTRHFLLAGTMQCIPGSKVTDFEFCDDGLAVRNVNPLDWVKLDFGGHKARPNIPAKGVKVSVSEDQLQLEFSGLTWKHPLMFGNDIFHLNFMQTVFLKMKRNAQGHPVFITSNTRQDDTTGEQVPNISYPHITVTPDATAVKAQRIISIISMVCAALGGVAAFIKVARVTAAGFEAVSDTATAVADMINEGDSIFDLAIEADSIALAQRAVEVAAGTTDAAGNIAGTSTSLAAKSLTYFNSLAMMGGAASMVAMQLNWEQKAKLAKNNEWDPDSVPAINHFLDNVVGTAHWPTLPKWEMKEAQLAKSLLLYGDLST